MHDAIDTTLATLRATHVMLGCLIDTGDDYSQHSYGINMLLRQQCDDIEEAVTRVRNNNAKPKETPGITGWDHRDPWFLRGEYARHLKERRPSAAWVETLAHTTGLPSDAIERVLDAVEAREANELVDEYRSQAPHREYLRKKAASQNTPDSLGEGPIPDHFRVEALAERLGEGVDAAKIAKAVNLKPETVERVIAQLLAEPEEADKATGTEG